MPSHARSQVKNYMEFHYLEKGDYDKSLKINGDYVAAYSPKKLNRLYPKKDYYVIGETFEKKKRDRQNDIGRIELNEKRLNVGLPGKHNKFFKQTGAYVEVEGGGFIAILKAKLLPIILIAAIALGGIGAGAYLLLKDNGGTDDPDNPGGDIKPIDSTVLTISGTVTMGSSAIEDAVLSLQKGNTEIATASTDASGKYLLNDVKNGNYNLVCTSGKSSLTQSVTVQGDSVTVNFTFPNLGDDTNINAIVKIVDDETPAVTVGGLSDEAEDHTVNGRDMDLTFFAKKLNDESVPANDQIAIEALSGDLEITYFDFSVLKEIYYNGVLEDSYNINKLNNVLEVAVAFDSTKSLDTCVLRYHAGSATLLTELESRPADNYEDGTYYVSGDTVYIYADSFSTYAIGAAYTENVVRGSDTLTYSSNATVNLKTRQITMLYKHDADSTNSAKVSLYLVGENSNTLIAESDTIPAGYQITSVGLLSSITSLPVGTYEGLMRISYLGNDGGVATNVEVPLVVAITK